MATLKNFFILAVIAILFNSTTVVAQSINNDIAEMWTNPMVLTDISQSYTVRMVAKKPNLDSIRIYEGQNTFIDQGVIVPFITLKDDGLEGDELAGDEIFTSQELTLYAASNFEKPGRKYVTINEIDLFYSTGTVSASPNTNAIPVRTYMPDEIPDLTIINESIQYSSRVVNVRVPLNDPTFYTSTAIEMYYEHFEDDKQWIALCRAHARGNGKLISNHQIKRHTAIGIYPNDELSGNGTVNGSEEKLEAIISFSSGEESQRSTFYHEIAHKWGAYLPQSFGMNQWGAHWSNLGAMDGNGLLGNGIKEFKDNGDGSYSAIPSDRGFMHLSDLELYLAGYIGIDEVNWPIQIMDDIDSFSVNMGLVTYYKTSPLRLLDKEEYLSEMQLRWPTPENWRTEEKMVFLVMSPKLLTPVEMSFYHRLAKEHARTDGESIYSPTVFYEITGERITLNTLVSPKVINNSHETSTSENSITLFPNPSGDKVYVKSTISYKNITVLDSYFRPIGFSEKNMNTIDVSALISGIYFVKFTTADNRIFTKKLVVLH